MLWFSRKLVQQIPSVDNNNNNNVMQSRQVLKEFKISAVVWISLAVGA